MMNFLKTILITFSLLLVLPLYGYEIWVSPNGNDSGDGTKQNPYKSIYLAQRKARELRRLNSTEISDGISIILKEGEYILDEPLLFRPEDSGTVTSPTTFKTDGKSSAVISGGIEIKNWKILDSKVNGIPNSAESKIWVADIPKVGGNRLLFRQMWVDNKKTQRASTLDSEPLQRILSVDKENEIMWIPKQDFEFSSNDNFEFIILQWWAIANLRVRDFIHSGDSTGVKFHQPESRIEFQHPWPAPFIDGEKNLNGNSAFYFANSIKFLNNPGEWYADMDNGKIYYWPRKGEKLNRSKIVVPYLENLVTISGTADYPVKYINFENISFQHTSWLRPSLKGHVPLQAGMYILEAYNLDIKGTPEKADLCNLAWTGRQSAAIEVSYAQNLKIENCDFRHLAATGIDFIKGTSNNLIEGNILTDIGGTAIQLGFFGDLGFENHFPYNPIDKRELCRYEKIWNNLIVDATNEDWGCVGIGVGYAHNIDISHNEINGVNYSAISLGWGWTKDVNAMKNNRVYANKIYNFARMLYDVGGVYTLSAQPNTVIEKNSIFNLLKAPYAHIPDHHQYIYFDEGSSYIRAIDNWTEKDKFFSNTPGPGNEWENNGPVVSDEIKNSAGLEKKYHYLKKKYDKIIK